MTTETINGLHTCQPGNAPSVGQIKSFLVTNETSERTGNQWTKIRSATPDKGGRHYRVVGVKPTDRGPDKYGNVSFNLDLEEAQAPAAPQQNGPSASPEPRGDVFNGRPAQSGITTPFDTVQQHLMRSANLYCEALETAAIVVRDKANRLGLDFTQEDYRQIATSLFINAKDQGYISHMSDKEQKPQQRKEPY